MFRKKPDGGSSIEQYMDFLDSLTEEKAERLRITTEEERPPVWTFVYRRFAGEHNTTGFTYGLSSVDHPAWRLGKPELIISVDSADQSWCVAAGHLAKTLRGVNPFTYGSVIPFGEKISPDSGMTSFLVFAPSVLEPHEKQVRLPDRTINLVQLYPIYEEEAAVIQRVGLDRWFSDDYDPASVTRSRRMTL